jgi:hypothetical protein
MNAAGPDRWDRHRFGKSEEKDCYARFDLSGLPNRVCSGNANR